MHDRYLTRDGDSFRVDPSLVARIAWGRVNLAAPDEVARQGTFDFILCRNVLIYFRDQTASRVVESLQRALRPGGALLVSVSESLMRFGTSLQFEEHEGIFIYRNAGSGHGR